MPYQNILLPMLPPPRRGGRGPRGRSTTVVIQMIRITAKIRRIAPITSTPPRAVVLAA